ncbi:hypothetical protein AC249_AIPGENE10808 [Exaiptasia diaphana]|nr:hypothetical protein AC249_AIPGENE10808 [Exaiptasia diaphana]
MLEFVPQISLPLEKDDNIARRGSELRMGWALKHPNRLSKKQKDFLLDIYNVGSQTGHKADPSAVCQSMRRARLPSGEPMFLLEDHLSSQQIASFFSRETAKRKATPTSAERESALHEIQREVVDAIAIHQPILYNN